MSSLDLVRGKRCDNDEWVNGNLIVLDDGTHCIATSCLQSDDNLLENICAYKVYPETCGRYIGLSDVNNHMIFEGDILYSKKGNFTGYVKYNETISSYIAVINDSKAGYLHWSFMNEGDVSRSTTLTYTTTLGNIHDNPELMNAEELNDN